MESKSANPLRLLHIVSLPLEIYWTILEQIACPADLNNLSQTCKTLHFIVQPKLYKHVRIQLPPRYPDFETLEHLLSPTAQGVRFTKGISIIANPGCDRYYRNEDWASNRLGFRLSPPESDSLRQNLYDSKVLNTFIRLLVVKIPANQLFFLHWYHKYQLSVKTIELLANLHGVSMRSLQFDNASQNHNFQGVPVNLETLHASSLNPARSASMMSYLMIESCCTLKHLKLGWESFIAHYYSEGIAVKEQRLTEYGALLEKEVTDHVKETKRLSDLAERGEQLSDLVEEEELAEGESVEEKPLFYLDTLHLIGLDLNDMARAENSPIFDFTNLKSLCLESCAGLGGGLSRLTGIRENQQDHPRMPHLESLVLRHEMRPEMSSSNIHGYLKAFLISFAGLKHLSVLIEGSPDLLPMAPVLQKHGPTLETLVWSERPQRETELTRSTYRATAEFGNLQLAEICSTCPNLRELGIAVKWDLDAKGILSDVIEKGIYTELGPLNSLEYLKTLNIRNMPPPYKGDLIDGPAEAFFIGIAQTISRQLGQTRRRWTYSPSTLNLIVFGAVTYKDMIFARSRESGPMDHYLTPRYYHIVDIINIRGERTPVITFVGRGTSFEARNYSEDLRIFEPYWMG